MTYYHIMLEVGYGMHQSKNPILLEGYMRDDGPGLKRILAHRKLDGGEWKSGAPNVYRILEKKPVTIQEVATRLVGVIDA